MAEYVEEAGDGRAPLATVAERVFEAIQAAIVNGDVEPGMKLTEPELARHYGVSRGPLREALQRLESQRLVERIPHVGARVASLSFAQLIELYEAREALEGMACRLAAERMSDAEVHALRELLSTHAELGDVRAGRGYFQAEGDLDFHYRIARGSRNSIVQQILCEDLYHLMRMYRYKFSGFRGRPHRALEEHQRIVDAIEERDGEFAELLMRRHIKGARRTIEAAHRRVQQEAGPTPEEPPRRTP